MARGVNKVIQEAEKMYIGGQSLPEVSRLTGIAISTLRYRFMKAGILRSRAEGVRQAAANGNLGTGMRGKRRNFTEKHKKAISEARLRWGDQNAVGTRITSSGYVEFTRGPHKGRLEHVVVMEERLQRPLFEDESVHHIDGCKTNNQDNNLALCTRSGHARIHRREDALSGNQRRRKENGTWG